MIIDKRIKAILRENILQEGLIKSYDVNKLVNILNKRFRQQEYIITFVEQNKFGVIILNTSIVDTFEDLCFVCGWYCAIKKRCQHGIQLQIEKKFQNKFITVSELVNQCNCRYLHHITLRHNLKHIEKKGLLPSSKNDQFKYPDRIYFLITNDFRDVVATATMLSINREDDSDQNYIDIIIDLNKINPDIKFYLDPNIEENDSLYTMDNITPQAIDNVIGVPIMSLTPTEKQENQVRDRSNDLPIKNRY